MPYAGKERSGGLPLPADLGAGATHTTFLWKNGLDGPALYAGAYDRGIALRQNYPYSLYAMVDTSGYTCGAVNTATRAVRCPFAFSHDKHPITFYFARYRWREKRIRLHCAF